MSTLTEDIDPVAWTNEQVAERITRELKEAYQTFPDDEKPYEIVKTTNREHNLVPIQYDTGAVVGYNIVSSVLDDLDMKLESMVSHSTGKTTVSIVR